MNVMRSVLPRISRLGRRFLALGLISIFLSTISPVLAEDPLPTTSPVATPDAITPSPTETPSPEPRPTSSESHSAQPRPTSSESHSAQPRPTSSESHSAQPHGGARSDANKNFPASEPTFVRSQPTKNQTIRINVASVIPVDPRAHRSTVPAISITGPEYLLVCMQGANLSFDVNAGNSTNGSGVLVSGDISSRALISGTTAQVNAIINGAGGTKILGLAGPVGGHYAVFNFVALSHPSLEQAFCNLGSPTNNRVIYLRALGINRSLIKGSIKLKN